MLNQIIQEFLILKSHNLSRYIIFSLIGISLLLISLAKSDFYSFCFDTYKTQYLFGLMLEFKIFWGLTNILAPFLIIYLMGYNKSQSCFNKGNDYVPFQFLELYMAKLIAIGLVLFFVGTIFGLVLFAKVIFYSHLGLNGLSLHLVTFKWVYLITVISLFYFNLLLFLFYCFRSVWLVIAFHAVNILFLFIDDLYWLPINWASTSIEYLQHRITPMNFFFEHPPILMGLFLVTKVVFMSLVLCKMNSVEK